MTEIRRTRSVCPRCLRQLPARQLRDEQGRVWLEKECPEHGLFRTLIWRGYADLEEWRVGASLLEQEEELDCPSCSHGICANHQQGSCCVLLNVTQRCNLSCRFCFAQADARQHPANEPTLEELKRDMDNIAEDCIRRDGHCCTIILSGGEPTLRDDLPELMTYIKQRGAPYIQLNSNGIRLGEDEDYVRALAKAGLDYVFLQFDGVDDTVYRTLRGRPLLETKIKCIELCGKYRIGVTLVPVVARGVNENQVGDIVRFGAARSPVVRGVHFQPVSYFGRFPTCPEDDDRYTLDELIRDLTQQIGLSEDYILPSCCDHPLCGFHSGFMVQENGTLLPLSRRAAYTGEKTTAQQNREYVGSRWSRETGPLDWGEESCCCDTAGECGCGDTAESCCCDTTEPCCCGEAPAAENCCCDSAGECGCGETSSEEEACCCCGNHETSEEELLIAWESHREMDLDEFIARAKKYSFTVSAMPFQDALNLDIERLRRCSLHVYQDGVIKPFCSRYLTAMPLELPEEK